MRLSADQEYQYIQSNMPWITYIIRKMKLSSYVYQKYYDDLKQEVIMTLIDHARRSSTPEELGILPSFEAHNRLCRFMLATQPLTAPIRTVEMKNIRQRMPETVSLESTFEEASNVPASSDDFAATDERLSFAKFLDEIDERDRVVLITMGKCGSVSKTAAMLGRNPSTISRCLAKNKVKYLAMCGDEGYLGGRAV